MIIVKRAGRRRPGHVSHICGLALTFNPMRVGGQAVFGTVVDDDHEKALELQRYCQGHPAYDVLDAAAVPSPPATAADLGATDPKGLGPGQMAPPVEAALAQGWTPDDLDGAGENDNYGPGGGFSKRTGLTMAQMALSTPPGNWAEEQAAKYPWECVDWKTPGIGFVPPNAPAKVAPKAADPADLPDEPVDTEDGEPGEAGTTDSDPPSGNETSTLDEGDTAETSSTDDAGPADNATSDDEVEDPAVAAGYPADQVDMARAMAHELVAARDEVPHPNAFNYVFGKAGLATINEAKRDALLSLPPAG